MKKNKGPRLVVREPGCPVLDQDLQDNTNGFCAKDFRKLAQQLLEWSEQAMTMARYLDNRPPEMWN
jgi:hypothetical protein